jgi:hypothetical protein
MKYKSSVYQAFVMVMQFGLNMLVPILACTVFGAWLGEKLGMDWLAIPLFFIGALAGARNCHKMAKRIYMQDEKGKSHQADAKKN